MNLITSTSPKMATTELLALVNEARSEFSEPAVRHNDFVGRCRDELDGEYYETFVIKLEGRGRPSEALRLTPDQCKLVAMRESKGVRRRVLARLNNLENQQSAVLPGNYIQALEHLLESKRAEQAAIEQRDHAVATKAEIGNRREATAMATASAAVRHVRSLENELGRGLQQATVTAVEKAAKRKFGKQGFRPLKNWCDSRGISAPKVHDARYGWVRSWPAAAWAAVYQIDLADLFGTDGEQA
ncbi:ORF6N domain-containing protein [Pseudomonas syringae group genomosp. 3]|uniref:ORF6N domain-containing protein n=1 Tax=Pseudomonas syringae group genomosp. 3 TaxID=251701 RepID=UPI0006CDF4F5|nr:ORF6N domain-containing protein [Pseudomonas syringae group genomosp. 3]KPC13024.1 Antirepressor [Pseudomonas syringae pv. maculicola]